MTSIAVALKQEITRLSRKAGKAELTALKSAVQAQRKQIAALRKQVASLAKQMERRQREAPPAKSEAREGDEAQQYRFVAKGFRSLRSRLGLTLEEMARLLGVSQQSVYNWEHQRAKPRPAQLKAIADLRAMGKRVAQARLNEQAGGQ